MTVLLLGGLPAMAEAAPKGAQVGGNLPVTATDARVQEANNSPVLAADPTEPRFVALASRLDEPDFGCALHVSSDGGRYWVPLEPVPALPAGAEKCYAPELAFDRNGTLYYLFVGLHGLGNSPMGAFLVTSSDRGRSFSPPLPILGRDERQIVGPYNYMVRMAIDPAAGSQGRIHLAWLHAVAPPTTGALPAQGNPILSSYSDDGGKTFSEPVQVSDAERRRVVAPALAIGAEGSVHVAYYDLHDDVVDYQGLEGGTWEGNWSMVVTTSPNGGRRFQRGAVVDGRVVPSGRVMLIFTMPPPALATSAPGEMVYVAWPDGRHGDPDILLSRSSNGGRGWEKAQRLNDDPRGNGAHQALPRLSAGPDGRLDAVFHDRRDDSANVSAHVYYTSSDDGGRRFSPNSRLTSKPSDSRIGPTYESIPSAKGLVDFGSRLGLLSRRSGIVAAWPDTRRGVLDGRQDVFSTTVRIPQGDRRTRPQPWTIVAAAVLGSAVAGVLRWRQGRRT